MDRLIATNSVPLANADTAPVSGTPQYATDGNPQTNTPATVWPAYQYNAIQEELLGIITKPGTAPDRTNLTQLFQALQTMFASGIELHAASGTSTVPVWATRAHVRVWGAGGAGAGSASSSIAYAGEGGGAGGYSEGIVAVTPGATIPVTIAGQSIGGTAGNSGASGGTSSFGSFVSATGGTGGAYASPTSTSQKGGGIGSGGSINLLGGPGSVVVGAATTGLAIGAAGGNAPAGGQGGVQSGSVASFGTFPGGGGGGAGGNGGFGGGDGAAGFVIVRYLP